MKVCKKCGVGKPAQEFYKRSAFKDGLQAWCKKCANADVREWQRKHPRKRASYQLENKYGISLDEYDIMFASQNGVCAICGQPETGRNQYGAQRLAVDHNHSTGDVRGLLCKACNQAIGLMGESVPRLVAAANYLAEWDK